MNDQQIARLHDQLLDAVRPVLAQYSLELLPSTLRYDADTINLPIKAMRKATPTLTALKSIISEDTLKAGYATTGTPAFVYDRQNHKRPVIITESKVKKYGFYFSDVPESSRQHMVGPFRLFTTIP